MMKRMIHLFLTIFMGLLVSCDKSCDKSSDFQVLNYSDADWESVDPFEAHILVMTDLKLLLKKHQENPDIELPEDEMQTFHDRLLQNFQFFHPGENTDPTMPLTCKGMPVNLTEEESLEKVQLLQSWTEGRLLQFQPQTFNEQSEGYFNMLGLKADLNGIATVLQADTKTETAMQAVVLLAIRRPLTDWDSKGEAKLYWWSFKNKRSLLYITHRTAIIFYENELGNTEIIFCLNRDYFQNRVSTAKE